MDKVVHFELPADDLQRARKFYNEVFGWTTNEIPEMHYTMVQTGPSDEQGTAQEAGMINGGMMERNEDIGCPVITIGVREIDEAVRQVESHGGKIVLGKTQVGDMGFSAYFRDPEGNTVGLWQDAA